MFNIGYGKALNITNMQMIITEIWCRLGQSRNIRRNMLIHTSVQEPNRSINITNNKIGNRLLSIAVKLRALRGCVAEREVELTLDVLLKGSMRRSLRKAKVPFILLPVAVHLVGVSRPLKTMKIRLILVVVGVVVGTPGAMKTTSITAKARAVLILGKDGQR